MAEVAMTFAEPEPAPDRSPAKEPTIAAPEREPAPGTERAPPDGFARANGFRGPAGAALAVDAAAEVGAPGRARMSATLQRSVGNARTAELMAAPPVREPVPPAPAPPSAAVEMPRTPEPAPAVPTPAPAAEPAPVAPPMPAEPPAPALASALEAPPMPAEAEAAPPAEVMPAPAGEPEAAAAPAAPTIDSSSPEALLQSAGAAPPSMFAAAVAQASEALPAVQAQEKTDLAASFPEVERPTGLPRMDEAPTADETRLEGGAAPEAPAAPSREGAPPEVRHDPAHGPVPAAGVMTSAPEPADADEGGWWNWLVNRVRRFLSQLPTRDPSLSTSAGERPGVDLSGEADPNRNAQQKQASDAELATARADAAAATSADFGENAIYPTVSQETLRPSYIPSAPPARAAAGPPAQPPVAAEVQAALDKQAAGWLADNVNEQLDRQQQERTDYERQSDDAREDGRRRIEEETARTREEQEAIQAQARGDVTAERERWSEENQRIQADYAEKSESKRQEVDTQIGDEVRSTQRDADAELARAEAEADAERRRTEEEAAQKKREAEKRPRSWWDRVKGAVGDFFQALKDAVNALFDALRSFVKKVIEAAKAVVRGLIEAARMFVVGLIKVFGEFLKGLVTIALAAFPELAARARAAIDGAVDVAVAGVNAAADALKKATDAILDLVGEALDFYLSVYQKALILVIEVYEFIVVGLLEILERLGNLVTAAREMPDHFLGQLSEEVLGMDVTQPLPMERTEPPDTRQVAERALIAGTADPNAAHVLTGDVAETDVTVDQVIPWEMEPELMAGLSLEEGEEIEFGEQDDPARTLEGARAEAVLGPHASSGETALGGEPAEAEAAQLAAGPGPEEELKAVGEESADGCAKEKPGEPADQSQVPESMKIGPLKPMERAKYLGEQIVKGVKQWFSCNWPWLLAAAVGVLLGGLVLNIVTGGAIMAALPLIMQIVSVVMAGVALARVASFIGEYLTKAWGGDIRGGAKSLARGLAAGAVELVFALLFNLGAVIKALRQGLRGAARAAAGAAKGAVKTAVKNVRQVGRIGVQGAKATVKNAKLVFKGLRSGFSRGAKSLDDFARRLAKRLRFRKFKIQFKAGWLRLLGYVNPWVVIMEGKHKGTLREVDAAQVQKIRAQRGKILGETATFTKSGETFKAMVVALKDPDDYREIFRLFNKLTKSDVRKYVIHHVVERQTKKILKRVTTFFLNAPARLRAFEKGLINRVVHLSQIRVMWNEMYPWLAGLGDDAIEIALLHFAKYTDDFIEHMDKVVKRMRSQGQRVTEAALRREIADYTAKNGINEAIRRALRAAGAVAKAKKVPK